MSARRLSHVLHAVYCEPWLIRPEMHARIAEIVHEHVTGEAHADGGIAGMFADDSEPADILRVTDDGVAVIELAGVVGKRVGMLEKTSGVTDVDDVALALDVAWEDPNVRGIVLNVDSPGGTVTGVPELADKLYGMRDDGKRVVAYTDTMAASAAYWVASQAFAFYAAPSATVGSVGVYLPMLDSSRAYEAAGLRQEVIKAGKYKGVGLPGTALTDEQRARLQERVDVIHAQFKGAVSRGRGGRVPESAMEGQDVFASEAIDNGMVDMLGTLRDAIAFARN